MAPEVIGFGVALVIASVVWTVNFLELWPSDIRARRRKRLEASRMNGPAYRTPAELEAESETPKRVFCKDCLHLFDDSKNQCRLGAITVHPVYGETRKLISARRKNRNYDCPDFKEKP